MKKFEFSKIALAASVFVYLIGVSFSLLFCYMAIKSNDFASASIMLSAIIGMIGTVTGISYGFYSSKAKAENLIKIAQKNSLETITEASTLAQSVKEGY